MDYRNVKKSPAHLEEMLGLTEGERQVPVLVENDKVTVGFGGT